MHKEGGTLNCPHCATPLPDTGADICPGCGKSLGADPGARLTAMHDTLRALRAAQWEILDRFAALDAQLTDFATALGQGGAAQAAAAAPVAAPPAGAPAPAQPQEGTFLFETPPAQEAPLPTAPPVQKAARPEAPGPAAAPAPSGPGGPARSLEEEITASPWGAKKAHADSALEIRLGQKLLLAIGILVMLLGVGFFLKYSFDQGWVGPAGRVAGAFLWGMALLGGGELARRRGYRRYGLWLAGGGIGVLYFACFASVGIYALLPEAAAFGLAVLTTALAVALALVYDSMGLATLGLVGGFLSPVMLGLHGMDRLTMNTYVLLLAATAPALAARKRWTEPLAIASIGTWLHAAHWGLGPVALALPFIQGYMLLLAMAPALSDLRGLDNPNRKVSLLSPLNALAGFGFTAMLLWQEFGREYAAIASLAYCALFLLLGTALHRRSRRDTPSFPLALVSAALFLALTPPLLLSGGWVTSAWAVIGAGLLWAGLRLEDRRLTVWAGLPLGAALVKLFWYDHPVLFLNVHFKFFRHGFFETWPERSVTEALVGLALWFVVRTLAAHARQTPASPVRPARALPLYAGVLGVYLFAVLNIEVSALFWDMLPGARATAISVLWALFAVTLMVGGFRLRHARMRTLSLLLFGATLLKVFGSDVWNFSTPYRIVSFIALGLLLIGASFLYYRYKDRILPAPEGEGGAREAA